MGVRVYLLLPGVTFTNTILYEFTNQRTLELTLKHLPDMSEDFVSADIHHEHVSHESEEKAHSALNTKMIWKVFWILLSVTIFEVAISFTSVPKHILLYIFIALTIVKAYYIVGFFM